MSKTVIKKTNLAHLHEKCVSDLSKPIPLLSLQPMQQGYYYPSPPESQQLHLPQPTTTVFNEQPIEVNQGYYYPQPPASQHYYY